ncbi:hypothetical protein SHL15_8090 [Streptomyces hygroscopicus subsp. limoneus]|nr:hypothetical protein SHL15_8090 [Streptomyces hygroscopicus subsp. limoneus]
MTEEPWYNPIVVFVAGMSVPLGSSERMRNEVQVPHLELVKYLDEFQNLVAQVAGGTAQGANGDWPKAYVDAMKTFLSGDGADYISGLRDTAAQLADGAGEFAYQLDYTNLMIVLQVLAFLVEWAITLIMWDFNPIGAAIEQALLKELFKILFGNTLRRFLTHAAMTMVTNVALSTALDGLARWILALGGEHTSQGDQYRHSAVLSGAVQGAIGAGVPLVTGPIKKLISKGFSPAAVKSMQESIENALKHPSPSTPVRSAVSDLSGSVTPGTTTAVKTGAGLADAPLVKDLADLSGTFGPELAKLTVPMRVELAHSVVSKDAQDAFQHAVGDQFERAFGSRLGPDVAREMGAEWANAFMAHAVGGKNLAAALKSALDPMEKLGAAYEQLRTALSDGVAKAMPSVWKEKPPHLLLDTGFSMAHQNLSEAVVNYIEQGQFTTSKETTFGAMGGDVLGHAKHPVLGAVHSAIKSSLGLNLKMPQLLLSPEQLNTAAPDDLTAPPPYTPYPTGGDSSLGGTHNAAFTPPPTYSEATPNPFTPPSANTPALGFPAFNAPAVHIPEGLGAAGPQTALNNPAPHQTPLPTGSTTTAGTGTTAAGTGTGTAAGTPAQRPGAPAAGQTPPSAPLRISTTSTAGGDQGRPETQGDNTGRPAAGTSRPETPGSQPGSTGPERLSTSSSGGTGGPGRREQENAGSQPTPPVHETPATVQESPGHLGEPTGRADVAKPARDGSTPASGTPHPAPAPAPAPETTATRGQDAAAGPVDALDGTRSQRPAAHGDASPNTSGPQRDVRSATGTGTTSRPGTEHTTTGRGDGDREDTDALRSFERLWGKTSADRGLPAPLRAAVTEAYVRLGGSPEHTDRLLTRFNEHADDFGGLSPVDRHVAIVAQKLLRGTPQEVDDTVERARSAGITVSGTGANTGAETASPADKGKGRQTGPGAPDENTRLLSPDEADSVHERLRAELDPDVYRRIVLQASGITGSVVDTPLSLDRGLADADPAAYSVLTQVAVVLAQHQDDPRTGLRLAGDHARGLRDALDLDQAPPRVLAGGTQGLNEPDEPGRTSTHVTETSSSGHRVAEPPLRSSIATESTYGAMSGTGTGNAVEHGPAASAGAGAVQEPSRPASRPWMVSDGRYVPVAKIDPATGQQMADPATGLPQTEYVRVPYEPSTSVFRVLDGRKAGLTPKGVRDWLTEEGVHVPPGPVREAVVDHLYGVHDGEVVYQPHDAARLLKDLRAAAHAQILAGQDAVIDAVVETSALITEKYPPSGHFYLGLGRSPAAIIAALQATGHRAESVPLSDFRPAPEEGDWSIFHDAFKKYPPLTDEQRRMLHAHFDEFVSPHLEAGKDIVLIDYTQTGLSLFAAQHYLGAYLAERGFDGQVKALAMHQDIDTGNLGATMDAIRAPRSWLRNPLDWYYNTSERIAWGKGADSFPLGADSALAGNGPVLGQAFKQEAFDGLAEHGSYKLLKQTPQDFEVNRPLVRHAQDATGYHALKGLIKTRLTISGQTGTPHDTATHVADSAPSPVHDPSPSTAVREPSPAGPGRAADPVPTVRDPEPGDAVPGSVDKGKGRATGPDAPGGSTRLLSPDEADAIHEQLRAELDEDTYRELVSDASAITGSVIDMPPHLDGGLAATRPAAYSALTDAVRILADHLHDPDAGAALAHRHTVDLRDAHDLLPATPKGLGAGPTRTKPHGRPARNSQAGPSRAPGRSRTGGRSTSAQAAPRPSAAHAPAVDPRVHQTLRPPVYAPDNSLVMHPGYASGDQFGILAMLLDEPTMHVLIAGGPGPGLPGHDPVRDKSRSIEAFYLESGIHPDRIWRLELPSLEQGKVWKPLNQEATRIAQVQWGIDKKFTAMYRKKELWGVTDGTGYVASHFSDELRTKIRAAWKLDDHRDTEITAWLAGRGVRIPEGEKDVLVLWSRFTGKSTNWSGLRSRMEHDTSFEGTRQLLRNLAKDYKAVIITGDPHPGQGKEGKWDELVREMRAELGTENIHQLTGFWRGKDAALSAWGGDTRTGQFRLYDHLDRRHGVRHVGFRSGNLEAVALIGHDVHYLEDDGSTGSVRMQAWHDAGYGRTGSGGLAPGYERIVVSEPPTASGRYSKDFEVKPELRGTYQPPDPNSPWRKPVMAYGKEHGFGHADVELIRRELGLDERAGQSRADFDADRLRHVVRKYTAATAPLRQHPEAVDAATTAYVGYADGFLSKKPDEYDGGPAQMYDDFVTGVLPSFPHIWNSSRWVQHQTWIASHQQQPDGVGTGNDMAVTHAAHMDWEPSTPFGKGILSKTVGSHQETSSPADDATREAPPAHSPLDPLTDLKMAYAAQRGIRHGDVSDSAFEASLRKTAAHFDDAEWRRMTTREKAGHIVAVEVTGSPLRRSGGARPLGDSASHTPGAGSSRLPGSISHTPDEPDEPVSEEGDGEDEFLGPQPISDFLDEEQWWNVYIRADDLTEAADASLTDPKMLGNPGGYYEQTDPGYQRRMTNAYHEFLNDPQAVAKPVDSADYVRMHQVVTGREAGALGWSGPGWLTDLPESHYVSSDLFSETLLGRPLITRHLGDAWPYTGDALLTVVSDEATPAIMVRYEGHEAPALIDAVFERHYREMERVGGKDEHAIIMSIARTVRALALLNPVDPPSAAVNHYLLLPKLLLEQGLPPVASPDIEHIFRGDHSAEEITRAITKVYDAQEEPDPAEQKAVPELKTLSDYYPEKDWWNFYITGNAHWLAKRDLLKIPELQRDPGRYFDVQLPDSTYKPSPGYQQSMIAAYKVALDDEKFIARRLNSTEHKKLHELATRDVEGNFGWTGEGGVGFPLRRAVELSPDLLSERLLGRPVAKNYNVHGEQPITSFTSGLMLTRHEEGGAPRLVDAVYDRYYEEVGKAAPGDRRAVVTAIGRAVRTLMVIHAFTDANSRLNMRLILPKLLLENGLPPVYSSAFHQIFQGGYSLDQITDIIDGLITEKLGGPAFKLDQELATHEDVADDPAPESDLAAIEYATAAASFEKRLGRYLMERPQALEATRKVARAVWDVLQENDPGKLHMLGSLSDSAVGGVGVDVETLRKVVGSGNLRELSTLLYNATSHSALGSFIKAPGYADFPEIKEERVWRQPLFGQRPPTRPEDVVPPLSEAERAMSVRTDPAGREYLLWSAASDRQQLPLDSPLHQAGQGTGALVATGTSGSLALVLETVWRLQEVTGQSFDLDEVRLGLIGHNLQAGHHTLHELMRSAEIWDKAHNGHLGLRYENAWNRYRRLAPLTETELREHVAENGLFPDEIALGVRDPRLDESSVADGRTILHALGIDPLRWAAELERDGHGTPLPGWRPESADMPATRLDAWSQYIRAQNALDIAVEQQNLLRPPGQDTVTEAGPDGHGEREWRQATAQVEEHTRRLASAEAALRGTGHDPGELDGRFSAWLHGQVRETHSPSREPDPIAEGTRQGPDTRSADKGKGRQVPSEAPETDDGVRLLSPEQADQAHERLQEELGDSYRHVVARASGIVGSVIDMPPRIGGGLADTHPAAYSVLTEVAGILAQHRNDPVTAADLADRHARVRRAELDLPPAAPKAPGAGPGQPVEGGDPAPSDASATAASSRPTPGDGAAPAQVPTGSTRPATTGTSSGAEAVPWRIPSERLVPSRSTRSDGSSMTTFSWRPYEPSTSVFRVLDGQKAGLTPRRVRDWLKEAGLYVPPGPVRDVVDDHLYAVRDGEVVYQEHDAGQLLRDLRLAAYRQLQESQDTVIDAVVETSALITTEYPPEGHFYLGLGRSPAAIIAALQATGHPAQSIPLSNFRPAPADGERSIFRDAFKNRPPLSDDQRRMLAAHFDEFVRPHLEAGKDILLIDYTQSGRSLFAAQHYLGAYLAERGFDGRVKALAMHQQAFAHRLDGVMDSIQAPRSWLLHPRDWYYNSSKRIEWGNKAATLSLDAETALAGKGSVLGDVLELEVFDGLAEHGSYKILEQTPQDFEVNRPLRVHAQDASGYQMLKGVIKTHLTLNDTPAAADVTTGPATRGSLDPRTDLTMEYAAKRGIRHGDVSDSAFEESLRQAAAHFGQAVWQRMTTREKADQIIAVETTGLPVRTAGGARPDHIGADTLREEPDPDEAATAHPAAPPHGAQQQDNGAAEAASPVSSDTGGEPGGAALLSERVAERNWWEIYVPASHHATVEKEWSDAGHRGNPGDYYERYSPGHKQRMLDIYHTILDDPQAMATPLDSGQYARLYTLVKGLDSDDRIPWSQQGWDRPAPASGHVSSDLLEETLLGRPLITRNADPASRETDDSLIRVVSGEKGTFLVANYRRDEIPRLIDAVFTRHYREIAATDPADEMGVLTTIARTSRALTVLRPAQEPDTLNENVILPKLLLEQGFMPITSVELHTMFHGDHTAAEIAHAIARAMTGDAQESHPSDVPGDTKPTLLSEHMPEKDWWRLYIDPSVHNDAVKHAGYRPELHRDPGLYFDAGTPAIKGSPGYQKNMIRAYREVLDDRESLAKRMDATEHRRIHGILTGGIQGKFKWSENKTSFPLRNETRDDRGRIVRYADLSPDILEEELLGQRLVAPYAPDLDSEPITTYAKGFGVLNTNHAPAKAPRLVDAIYDRYYQEIAGVGDNRTAHLKAIARAIRALMVIHPFTDANSRLNIRLVLPKLLLQHGYPPVYHEDFHVLFQGSFSVETIAERLDSLLEERLGPAVRPSSEPAGREVDDGRTGHPVPPTAPSPEPARTEDETADTEQALDTLSDFAPEKEWWTFFIDRSDHGAATHAAQNDATTGGDPGAYYEHRHPGYLRGITEVYREALDDTSALTQHMDARGYERLHKILTKHMGGATRWSGDSRSAFRTGSTNLSTELFDEQFLGRKLVVARDGRSDLPDEQNPPLTIVSGSPQGDAVMHNAYGVREAPALVDAIFSRHYRTLDTLDSGDDHAILSTIARTVRALTVIHPFTAGNEWINVRVVLPRLLLEQGFPPAILRDAARIFDGRHSADEMAHQIEQSLIAFWGYEPPEHSAPQTGALSPNPVQAATDLAAIRYAEASAEFENNLGRHLVQHPRALRSLREVAKAVWEVLEEHNPDRLPLLGSTSRSMAGSVGRDVGVLREVIRSGNVRELATMLFNASNAQALRSHIPLPGYADFPEIQHERSWRRDRDGDDPPRLHPEDVVPPLSEAERALAVRSDASGREYLRWFRAADTSHLPVEAPLHTEGQGTGALVATGTSGSMALLLEMAWRLQVHTGQNFDLDGLRLGLLGHSLVLGHHSLHELLRSAAYWDSVHGHRYGFRYDDSWSRYRRLAPLTENELREHVAQDGRFPDEIARDADDLLLDDESAADGESLLHALGIDPRHWAMELELDQHGTRLPDWQPASPEQPATRLDAWSQYVRAQHALQIARDERNSAPRHDRDVVVGAHQAGTALDRRDQELTTAAEFLRATGHDPEELGARFPGWVRQQFRNTRRTADPLTDTTDDGGHGGPGDEGDLGERTHTEDPRPLTADGLGDDTVGTRPAPVSEGVLLGDAIQPMIGEGGFHRFETTDGGTVYISDSQISGGTVSPDVARLVTRFLNGGLVLHRVEPLTAPRAGYEGEPVNLLPAGQEGFPRHSDVDSTAFVAFSTTPEGAERSFHEPGEQRPGASAGLMVDAVVGPDQHIAVMDATTVQVRDLVVGTFADRAPLTVDAPEQPRRSEITGLDDSVDEDRHQQPLTQELGGGGLSPDPRDQPHAEASRTPTDSAPPSSETTAPAIVDSVFSILTSPHVGETPADTGGTGLAEGGGEQTRTPTGKGKERAHDGEDDTRDEGAVIDAGAALTSARLDLARAESVLEGIREQVGQGVGGVDDDVRLAQAYDTYVWAGHALSEAEAHWFEVTNGEPLPEAQPYEGPGLGGGMPLLKGKTAGISAGVPVVQGHGAGPARPGDGTNPGMTGTHHAPAAHDAYFTRWLTGAPPAARRNRHFAGVYDALEAWVFHRGSMDAVNRSVDAYLHSLSGRSRNKTTNAVKDLQEHLARLTQNRMPSEPVYRHESRNTSSGQLDVGYSLERSDTRESHRSFVSVASDAGRGRSKSRGIFGRIGDAFKRSVSRDNTRRDSLPYPEGTIHPQSAGHQGHRRSSSRVSVDSLAGQFQGMNVNPTWHGTPQPHPHSQHPVHAQPPGRQPSRGSGMPGRPPSASGHRTEPPGGRSSSRPPAGTGHGVPHQSQPVPLGAPPQGGPQVYAPTLVHPQGVVYTQQPAVSHFGAPQAGRSSASTAPQHHRPAPSASSHTSTRVGGGRNDDGRIHTHPVTAHAPKAVTPQRLIAYTVKSPEAAHWWAKALRNPDESLADIHVTAMDSRRREIGAQEIALANQGGVKVSRRFDLADLTQEDLSSYPRLQTFLRRVQAPASKPEEKWESLGPHDMHSDVKIMDGGMRVKFTHYHYDRHYQRVLDAVRTSVATVTSMFALPIKDIEVIVSPYSGTTYTIGSHGSVTETGGIGKETTVARFVAPNKILVLQGYRMTPKIITHEFGHMSAYLTNLSLYTEVAHSQWASQEVKQIAYQLPKMADETDGATPYASTNPMEFVAEVFTVLAAGKKLPRQVEQMYKAFGGVMPR